MEERREDRFERDSSREKHGSQCRIDFTSGYIFLRPFERGLRGQCIFNCADYSEWLLTAECVCIIPRPAFFHSSLLFMEKARSNRLFFFFFFSIYFLFFASLSRDRDINVCKLFIECILLKIRDNPMTKKIINKFLTL